MVVALAVVPLAVVVALAAVEAMVVVSDPPPKHASVWRTAAMAIKKMQVFMTLALQKCQLRVISAFK